MPKVRTWVGFREFLLLVTLGSLIAASLALRARVQWQDDAIQQARIARLAWQNAANYDHYLKVEEESAAQWPDSVSQAYFRLRIATAKAQHASAVAEAESAERLARYYAAFVW